jgi:hypothetical protein
VFERDTHRRSVDALEYEVGSGDVEDRRGGKAMRADVADDVDLVLGDVAPSVAPEHPVLVQRVDVGVPSPSEELVFGYAFTT